MSKRRAVMKGCVMALLVCQSFVAAASVIGWLPFAIFAVAFVLTMVVLLAALALSGALSQKAAGGFSSAGPLELQHYPLEAVPPDGVQTRVGDIREGNELSRQHEPCR